MAYFGDNAIHAWADIDGTGTVHLDNSYNCTGVTDNGGGDYTINFSTNTSNAHYSIVGSNIGESNDEYTFSFLCSGDQTAPTTSGCRFQCAHRSGSLRDQDHLNIVVVAEYA